jgi:hypothetical protein
VSVTPITNWLCREARRVRVEIESARPASERGGGLKCTATGETVAVGTVKTGVGMRRVVAAQ